MAFVAAPMQARAETVAGATSGAFSVDASGGASYTVPITVPPGVAGMQPELSLKYESQDGNGLLGVGWSLGGLSVIHRCGRTIAQDGVKGGVLFNEDDRFCLDGQRLIAVSGAYGADGSEYRTEVDSFARILAYGAAGTGPSHFTVETKEGRTLEYGFTADSRVGIAGRHEVHYWVLNRVEDSAGNYMDLHYLEDVDIGTRLLDRIDYAGNSVAGTLPQSQIKFIYEPRPDPVTRYQAGARIDTTQRLATIQTFTEGGLVRDYRLAYDSRSTTGRSRLRSVTECEGGGDCLAPLSFGWNPTPAGWVEEPSYDLPVILFDHVKQVSGHRLGEFADVNGDGRVDFVRANSGSSAARETYINTGNGWEVDPRFRLPTVLYVNGIQPQQNHKYGELLDINGDGLTDFVHIDKRVWLGTTEGWERNAGYALPETFRTIWTSPASSDVNTHGDFLDVNGDGLVDLVIAYYGWDLNDLPRRIDFTATYLNTGSGWAEAPDYALPEAIYHHYGNVHKKKTWRVRRRQRRRLA